MRKYSLWPHCCRAHGGGGGEDFDKRRSVCYRRLNNRTSTQDESIFCELRPSHTDGASTEKFAQCVGFRPKSVRSYDLLRGNDVTSKRISSQTVGEYRFVSTGGMDCVISHCHESHSSFDAMSRSIFTFNHLYLNDTVRERESERVVTKRELPR